MKRSLGVFLGQEAQPLGTLRYESRGTKEASSLEYSPSWLHSPGRFSLDPALPLVVGPQFHRKTRDGSVFHSCIADTEPDGWGRRVILRDHAKLRQACRVAGEASEPRPLNSLDFLLAVDDFSRVGALRFQNEEGQFERIHEEGGRSAPPLLDLGQLFESSRAVELGSESQSDLDYLRGCGTSLGGMRPKCTVIDDHGRLSIGKFPSVSDERAVTKGEVLALRLAAAAGINAAEARLVDSHGVQVALIKRFDRTPAGRLMYVSAATLLGATREDPVEHTYTEIVDVLRVRGADAQSDIEELWRRVAFSILITNTDDHLHNHGFIGGDRGLWRLSPAFDLNPFPERHRDLETWISEEAGPSASIEGLMSVAPYFRISPAKCRVILARVEESVSSWRQEGRRLGMSDVELDAFASAFEHVERDAARKAIGG